MYVKERKNKDGSISYIFKCSTKTANDFQQHTKTVRLPSHITGKKAIKEWLTQEQMAWKRELTHRDTKYTIQQSDMLFIDFARRYVEDILVYKPTAYHHYNACKLHLKIVESKLGKFLISELTTPILQSFCKWLIERRYEKYTITAKPAFLTLISERQITLRSIAEGCKIAHTTLFAALHGKCVSKTTATKICNYLKIPLKQYFTVEKECKPYSHSANNGVKVFIHGVLNEAVREGLTTYNAASSLRPIGGTEGKKEILESLDEYKQFLSFLNEEKDLRKKAAFALLAYGGLRSAEICGCQWRCIDFEKNTIAIVQNTIYAGKRFGTVNKPPKSKNSNRLLVMPTALAEILKEYRAWWLVEQERHGDLWAGKDKLFLSNAGKETSGGTLAGWLKEFEEKHGLKNVTPHGLRHSVVTVLIANGVDVKTVSARAGHADIQTTLNIYSHYTKEADRQAADRIDELFDT